MIAQNLSLTEIAINMPNEPSSLDSPTKQHAPAQSIHITEVIRVLPGGQRENMRFLATSRANVSHPCGTEFVISNPRNGVAPGQVKRNPM